MEMIRFAQHDIDYIQSLIQCKEDIAYIHLLYKQRNDLYSSCFYHNTSPPLISSNLRFDYFARFGQEIRFAQFDYLLIRHYLLVFPSSFRYHRKSLSLFFIFLNKDFLSIYFLKINILFVFILYYK